MEQRKSDRRGKDVKKDPGAATQDVAGTADGGAKDGALWAELGRGMSRTDAELARAARDRVDAPADHQGGRRPGDVEQGGE
ncbi:MAG: hypothetical protein QF893_17760 [Alphaproteobacteria bacterium]|jgi:hypothetical protein|nr:hypothetical protein [Alphaproteobacteria bacterium]